MKQRFFNNNFGIKPHGIFLLVRVSEVIEERKITTREVFFHDIRKFNQVLLRIKINESNDMNAIFAVIKALNLNF